MNRLKKFIARKARKIVLADRHFKINPSSKYIHKYALPGATLAPWLADFEFMNIYKKIKSFTLVDIYRCYELWSFAKQTENIVGDILEVGVWRGGTGAIIAQAAKTKQIFLADTFTGVVKTSTKDPNYIGGEHSDTSIELVKKLMTSLDLHNISLLQGVFPDATGNLFTEKISLLHCDVDVYESAKDIFEWALPKLSIGSVVIFDDYGFSSCEGITEFCDELRHNKNFKFIHNLNGHAIFIRMV